MIKRLLPSIFIAVLSCRQADAAPRLPGFGTTLYSNFCTSAQSGDLYGTRITLRRLPEGDMLVYEYTDGGTHATLANELVLDPTSGTIRFTIPFDGHVERLSGKFPKSGRSLELQGILFKDPEHRYTLARLDHPGSSFKHCR